VLLEGPGSDKKGLLRAFCLGGSEGEEKWDIINGGGNQSYYDSGYVQCLAQKRKGLWESQKRGKRLVLAGVILGGIEPFRRLGS